MPYGGTDYKEMYYWNQAKFLLTIYNWSSQIITIRVSALVCIVSRLVGCVWYFGGKNCSHCGYIIVSLTESVPESVLSKA